MDRIKQGWYSEINEFWPGQALSLEVDGEVLFHQKSQFQDVLVFKSKAYGNTLVLDDAIQITERDEMSYQEPLAHLTMFAHPNPKKVLVVGGGDGGILRELARHPSVEELHICEIDQVVIDAAKKYLPYSAVGFEDPRVKVHVRDGFEFIKEHKNEFDVIITDSSDPAGPASQLFNEAYFTYVKEALTENGILGTQAECIWLHLDLISSMKKFIGKVFPSVTYAITQTPTYPCGSLGFFLATKNGSAFPKAPIREVTADFQAQLKYYTKDLHTASFVLPYFAAKALDLQ
jgi:spermidine synthase